MIKFIAAIDKKNGLATDKGIPWNIPSDKRYFRLQTDGGMILMGFRTYEEFTKPLPNRQNFVLTHDTQPLRKGFIAVQELDNFLHACYQKELWIIGGASLFAQTIEIVDQLFLTRIHGDYHCTKFFPAFEREFTRLKTSKVQQENGISFSFEIWQRTITN